MVLDLGSAIGLIFAILLIAIVIGILHYVIGKAPFADPMIKAVLQWVLIVIGALIAIALLMNFFGMPVVRFR
jgi:hypothetical protein